MPRRKPFSNKQKKLQLQEKRLRKSQKGTHERDDSASDDHASLHSDPSPQEGGPVELVKLNSQPLPLNAWLEEVANNRNRFCLHFEKETNAEIEHRKHLAKTTPILPIPEIQMEVGVDEIYKPGTVLDIPQRPSWDYSMTKEELEEQEEKEFSTYLRAIYSKHLPAKLSYFEHNLETWRQLWRVLEISDVILLIVDTRHPVLHFSPALYSYVVEILKKQLILVLNKVDLVPPQVGVAWRHYFLSHFPQLEVICFTSFPDHLTSIKPSGKIKLKCRGRRGRLPSAVGAWELLRVVEKLNKGRTVHLDDWRQKLRDFPSSTPPPITGDSPASTPPPITGDSPASTPPPITGDSPASTPPPITGDSPTSTPPPITGDSPTSTPPPITGDSHTGDSHTGDSHTGDSHTGDSHTGGEEDSSSDEEDFTCDHTPITVSPFDQDKSTNNNKEVLTIGMVGHPNVGKSSLINGLMGKKMVSTSRTPGHTKHFQTIFLTPNIKLCDCPGLVFPSLVDKQIQILSGIYPIAQVREPYTAVGFLAQRTPLIEQLQLVHPEDEPPVHYKKTSRGARKEYPKCSEAGGMTKERMWTAWDICDAWAIRRGYYTSRAARPDTYRAANSILRLAVDGKISMYFTPPGFTNDRVKWEGHPEVTEMIQLQQAGMENILYSQQVAMGDSHLVDTPQANAEISYGHEHSPEEMRFDELKSPHGDSHQEADTNKFAVLMEEMEDP